MSKINTITELTAKEITAIDGGNGNINWLQLVGTVAVGLIGVLIVGAVWYECEVGVLFATNLEERLLEMRGDNDVF